jgi:gamma-glutamyltranspeptidase/glutathione hydrolase
VAFEDGISEHVIKTLERRGHKVKGPLKGFERTLFGRGHVITKGGWWEKEMEEREIDSVDKKYSWFVACDPRSDGKCNGY